MKVSNYCNVKNQFLIETKTAVILQSYDSIVCKIITNPNTYKRTVYLLKRWDYSSTTVKYVKRFINDFTAYTVNTKEDIRNLISIKKIVLR